jgi:hypothetical protein
MNELNPKELNFLYLLISQTLEDISDVSTQIMVEESNESFQLLKSIHNKLLNKILGELT